MENVSLTKIYLSLWSKFFETSFLPFTSRNFNGPGRQRNTSKQSMRIGENIYDYGEKKGEKIEHGNSRAIRTKENFSSSNLLTISPDVSRTHFPHTFPLDIPVFIQWCGRFISLVYMFFTLALFIKDSGGIPFETIYYIENLEIRSMRLNDIIMDAGRELKPLGTPPNIQWEVIQLDNDKFNENEGISKENNKTNENNLVNEENSMTTRRTTRKKPSNRVTRIKIKPVKVTPIRIKPYKPKSVKIKPIKIKPIKIKKYKIK